MQLNATMLAYLDVSEKDLRSGLKECERKIERRNVENMKIVTAINIRKKLACKGGQIHSIEQKLKRNVKVMLDKLVQDAVWRQIRKIH